MKLFMNFASGFVVGFLGSVLPGYLSFAGLEIYSDTGLYNLMLFLLGIIFVESFVVYFTLYFADGLARISKLLIIIDIFSAVLMFAIAYVFYKGSGQQTSSYEFLMRFKSYSPFVMGIVLNAFNFLQLPFWTAWNLYLLKKGYIDPKKKWKHYYLAGTMIGVFLAMLIFIVVLHAVFQNINPFYKSVFCNMISLFFTGLGINQLYRAYQKYFKSHPINLMDR